MELKRLDHIYPLFLSLETERWSVLIDNTWLIFAPGTQVKGIAALTVLTFLNLSDRIETDQKNHVQNS